MKNFPTPQYRIPARWWRWKCKTLRQQTPPPGKTFDNKCATLGGLWSCHPFISARFPFLLKKGEEKKENLIAFLFALPEGKEPRSGYHDWNQPTVVCGRFPGSHGYFVCKRGLQGPTFSSWGYFGFEPSRMLVVFFLFEVISFLYLLVALIALSIIESALSLWSTS